MRQLVHRRTSDGAQQILERRPGPYSHSAPVETVVFEMTGEEAAAIQDADTGSGTAPVIPTKQKDK